MKRIGFTLYILILMSFASISHAGILIDPYLGYKFGGTELTLSNSGLANGTYEYDVSGTEYGLRLGYKYMVFYGGLTYGLGSVEQKLSKAPAGISTGTKNKYDTQNFGLFAGFSGVPLFNFWATYYLNNEWEDTDGTNVKDTFSGKGYSLGAGFTGLPFISLNLEYKMFTFDETKDASAGTTTNLPTSTTSEYDTKEIFFSVSVPFDL